MSSSIPFHNSEREITVLHNKADLVCIYNMCVCVCVHKNKVQCIIVYNSHAMPAREGVSKAFIFAGVLSFRDPQLIRLITMQDLPVDGPLAQAFIFKYFYHHGLITSSLTTPPSPCTCILYYKINLSSASRWSKILGQWHTHILYMFC